MTQAATEQSRTLWQISDDLTALEHLLLASGGEITEAEAEAEIDQWLAQLAETKAELVSKVDAYCGLIREMQTRAQLREEEAGRINRHAKQVAAEVLEAAGVPQMEREAARISEHAVQDYLASAQLEARLLAFFKLHKLPPLQTLRFRITAALVGGKRALVLDEQDVPDAYKKAVYIPDKDKIRAHLEAGGSLGFARLEERGMRLNIK